MTKRVRSQDLSVDADGPQSILGAQQRGLTEVMDDVRAMLIRFHGFKPELFDVVERRDCTEWQWAIAQLLRRRGTAQQEKATGPLP